jgi:hypothetical protein
VEVVSETKDFLFSTTPDNRRTRALSNESDDDCGSMRSLETLADNESTDEDWGALLGAGLFESFDGGRGLVAGFPRLVRTRFLGGGGNG